ncbi:fumarylacetoacetate hydrolase family protein [Novosphingobium sp. G106]|uniref:fumarylacetoacetate hydrolase family protein n=1 Tax=Novosphingobium sp. G106 TaxID=2849500 RepID=UPI001C2DD920|nr:fumarylacetoacetate hydrolase family protein [Novosphingobium sp. G106]MBV1686268.1 fumarylacetoacetate hydrolase family protein [Novosphingobium sp. G106]
MKLVSFIQDGRTGLAAEFDGGRLVGLDESDAAYPGNLHLLLSRGNGSLQAAEKALAGGREIDRAAIEFAPPIAQPGKIICIGLNYKDHADESGMEAPTHPTVFARFASGLVGSDQPMVLPNDSAAFDYEGEFVAVIGKRGRRIPRERALDHVAGYSLFNDGSIRDVQFQTSQWTVGKNYDGTGAFGPYFVTADALPKGCEGLRLVTRLNGQVLQDASTSDMIFDVATLISQLSNAFTLEPGDLIVTGTPSGVGGARNPPLYMKEGDVCEIEMEGLGILRNSIVAEKVG